MKTFLALLACLAIFAAYVLIGVSLGWKNGGGLIPNLILFGCVAAVWKGIRGGKGQSKSAAPVAWGEWNRGPASDDKEDAK